MAHTRRFLYRKTDPENNPTVKFVIKKPLAAKAKKYPDPFPVEDFHDYMKLVRHTPAWSCFNLTDFFFSLF